MRASQQDLFKGDAKYGPKNSNSHGGACAKKRAKARRPLDSRKPIHVILRSINARGVLSLKATREREARIASIMRRADKQGVRILSLANVGNHLHAIVRFSSRVQFANWLRVAAGLIARLVTGACRGKPFGKFWDDLTFTRVIHPGRDLEAMISYLKANRIEAWFGKVARELFLAEQADQRARVVRRKPS